MPALPDKLNYIKETKTQIADKIKSTGQDTNVPFRQYADLIKEIPNLGALSQEDINKLTELTIDLSAEKA